MAKVLVLTGGSSGIGKATALRFQKEGWHVYELSRSGEDFSGIHHLTADITDEVSVCRCIAKVVADEHHIDLLINNAGYGISGPIEDTETNEARNQFDVNFFGMLSCTKAVLPHMRKQRSGRIISLSSVAAVLSIPYQSFYSCTKAAINSFTLALANEVRPFGITVCAAMPGDVKTSFTANRIKGGDASGAYRNVLERSVSVMEHDEQNGMSPEYIAERLYRIAKKKRIRPLYTLGGKYRVFTAITKLVPARFSNWVVGKIYAK